MTSAVNNYPPLFFSMMVLTLVHYWITTPTPPPQLPSTHKCYTFLQSCTFLWTTFWVLKRLPDWPSFPQFLQNSEFSFIVGIYTYILCCFLCCVRHCWNQHCQCLIIQIVTGSRGEVARFLYIYQKMLPFVRFMTWYASHNLRVHNSCLQWFVSNNCAIENNG